VMMKMAMKRGGGEDNFSASGSYAGEEPFLTGPNRGEGVTKL
jgi:hypothetical protein